MGTATTSPIHLIEDPATSTSIKRYVHGLRSSVPDVQWYSILMPRLPIRLLSMLAKYTWFPLVLLWKRPARVILPSERYAFLMPFLLFSKSVVVCHDLHTLMDTTVPWYHKCHYKLMLRMMRLASAVVCISEHTRADFLRVFPGFDKSKLHVIHNGLEQHWFTQAGTKPQSSQLTSSTSYVLMVGSKAWYKNLAAAMKALALTNPELKIVKVGPMDEAAERIIVERSLESRLIRLDRVSDEELIWLYRHASLLFFPSIHEGFGWPPIEAMACRCLVLTSRKGSLEEVCGKAAMYTESGSPEKMAQDIAILLSDDRLQTELIEAGVLRAGQFDWKLAGRNFIELLKVGV